MESEINFILNQKKKYYVFNTSKYKKRLLEILFENVFRIIIYGTQTVKH